MPDAATIAALEAEIQTGIPFMYPWRLADGRLVPVVAPTLPAVHQTRERMIEPVVRVALNGPGAAAVDLGCHEGYFAQRALGWGAERVLGVDVREINVRRARLFRDYYGIPADRLEVREASVYELDPAAMGNFEVVLVLGLIYHLENPIGALRVAASLAAPGGAVVVETQLTRQQDPLVVGWGMPGEFSDEPASWAARYEPPEIQADTPLAAHGGVISLIPNAAAVLQAFEVIGLDRIVPIEPVDDNPQYAQGDRGVFVGYR